jgi:hypothetical protein
MILCDYNAKERLGCFSRFLKTAEYKGGNWIHMMICIDRHMFIDLSVSV